MIELLKRNDILQVIVRVSFGILWFESFMWKIPPTFGMEDNSGLYYWVIQAVEHPVNSLYASFVQSVILPNFVLFAWPVLIVEIILAVCFIFGLKTKWAAILAFITTTFITLSAANAPHEWIWTYFLMLLVSLALFSCDTSGSKFSLDYWINHRKSKNQVEGQPQS